MQQFERKREKWQDSISSAVQNCAERLARLKRRNDAVTDESERLNAEEFIICPQLARKLQKIGMERAAELKRCMRNEAAVRFLVQRSFGQS